MSGPVVFAAQNQSPDVEYVPRRHPAALPALPRVSVPPGPRSWNVQYEPPTLRHLAERFFLTIRPGGASERALAWGSEVLSDAEWRLFRELPGHDQRHALGVGRAAAGLTGKAFVGRAGVLHDIGKLDCRLGPIGRSVATLVRRAFPVTAWHWSERWWLVVRSAPGGRVRPRRWRDRFASYWLHPWIGRRMLEAVGSPAEVATWAQYHHWTYVGEDLLFSWEESAALWDCDCD